MTYRMPFTIPFLPMMLIVVIASSASMWIFNIFSSGKIREAQTAFALSQIVERIDQIKDADFPRTTADLTNILSASTIDWNSCEIEGEQILDGWGRPMTTSFDQKVERWTFRSFGRDGKKWTGDDIERATSGNKRGEQDATRDSD